MTAILSNKKIYDKFNILKDEEAFNALQQFFTQEILEKFCKRVADTSLQLQNIIQGNVLSLSTFYMPTCIDNSQKIDVNNVSEIILQAKNGIFQTSISPRAENNVNKHYYSKDDIHNFFTIGTQLYLIKSAGLFEINMQAQQPMLPQDIFTKIERTTQEQEIAEKLSQEYAKQNEEKKELRQEETRKEEKRKQAQKEKESKAHEDSRKRSELSTELQKLENEYKSGTYRQLMNQHAQEERDLFRIHESKQKKSSVESSQKYNDLTLWYDNSKKTLNENQKKENAALSVQYNGKEGNFVAFNEENNKLFAQYGETSFYEVESRALLKKYEQQPGAMADAKAANDASKEKYEQLYSDLHKEYGAQKKELENEGNKAYRKENVEYASQLKKLRDKHKEELDEAKTKHQQDLDDLKAKYNQ